MKKVSIILMAVAMVAFTACGNKKKSAQQADGKAEQSFEQVQLEAHIQMQVDSIAAMFSDKMPLPILKYASDGSIVLTDKEKQIKPSYLIQPSAVASTSTLMQKYRAVSLLITDQQIAKLYDMNVDEYQAALKKIVSEINDPAFKQFEGSKHDAGTLPGLIRSFYNDEVKNGRVNLFWELMGAFMIENMYVLSQNIDKFMPIFTDQDASDLTLRIFLIKQSVDQLVAYYPELESLSKSMEPLYVLNAMDVAEFRSQLLEMKGQLEIVRNNLIK